MNAPLQNSLQAATAKAHKKPKVFWTEKEQALVVGEVARLLLGADPAHTNLGPYIRIAQAALLPVERHRCVNSTLIGRVREKLLADVPAPEPVAAPTAQYLMWREVTAHELIDVLESNPNQLWRRGPHERLKVVERRFANAQEVADFYVGVGFIEEVTE